MRLRRSIAISAAIHVVLIAAFLITPALRFTFHERPMRITWVELPKGPSDEIELGMKKSEGLPKSTLEEQKRLDIPEKEPKQTPLLATKPKEAADAKEDRKTELAPRPKMKIDDKSVRRAGEKPKKRYKGSRRIQNALAKIDKQLKERQVVPEAAQIKEDGQGYKYGTGRKPLRVMPNDPEYLKYQARVRHKVMREWIVPMKFVEEGGVHEHMSCQLEVLINLDGDVVSVRWEHPSGNGSFDQSALRAVKKASPFPKPPDRLAWEAYNEGFLIEFDPRLKSRY